MGVVYQVWRDCSVALAVVLYNFTGGAASFWKFAVRRPLGIILIQKFITIVMVVVAEGISVAFLLAGFPKRNYMHRLQFQR